jgi:uncharacterized protein YbjT (DUF2867 family)
MSANNYKNVILLGATGNVGKYVLPALLADSSFNVTVLSRNNSSATFPSNVKVIKIDYSDTAALTKALANQDVVVSTIGGEGLASNFGEVLVQAAIDAKVKWIIPSEFGIDVEDPAANIPLLASKLAVANLLKKNQSNIAYTFITTGAFLDWGFDNGFLGFDIKNHTAVLYDEGKNLVSGTTLPTIAKAVVGTLRNPQLTQNKRIYVADATFTQQQALALFEKYTNAKWTVKNVVAANERKRAEENLAKGNIREAFGGYILSFAYGGNPGANFEGKSINKAIGVPTVPLEQIVKEAVQRQTAAQ